MPSQITHLAIAKKYLKKHGRKIKDVQRFLDGNVMPDLATNKAESHCGIRTEMYNLVKRNAEKINPAKFIATHDMGDDFNKGQYLHLLVDDQYYNHFLLQYFQTNTNIEQTAIDMYEVSRRDDAYLQQKYEVAYTDTTVGPELQVINDVWDNEYAERRCQPGYRFVLPYP